jgi:hypothetical protein
MCKAAIIAEVKFRQAKDFIFMNVISEGKMPIFIYYFDLGGFDNDKQETYCFHHEPCSINAGEFVHQLSDREVLHGVS